tara:strand:- start:561 stop:1298 length:738 start_codon:yes stop_codon:yes gene_type:complete
MLNSNMTNEDYLVSLLSSHDTRVLDFGSGEGNLVRKLHYAKFDAVGCDILQWYKACEGKQVNGLMIGKDLICNTENHIPFADEHFTSIVSNQVIEHISDLDAIARELNRVIKPGGFAYLLFPVKESIIEPHTKIPLLQHFNPSSIIFALLISIKIFMRNLIAGKDSRVSVAQKVRESRLYFQDHIHFRHLNDVKMIFEGAGFEVRDETSKWFMSRYSNSYILRLISFILKPKYFIGSHLLLRKFN